MNPFLRVTLPLAGVNFLNQASRVVIAVLGPAMAIEFALSASGLGALSALFFAAYALAQLPLGLALDLYGARRVQACMALVAGAGFVLCATAGTPLLLGLGRFITGLGIAAALIAIMQSGRQWYPPHRLAATTGAAVFLGAAGGLAATVPVQALQPLIGWRGAFWTLAALAVLVAGWVWLSVPARGPGPPPAARRSFGPEIAEFGRILRHAEFRRAVPAIAMLSGLTFTYQGLWAGPWLRDVGGLDGQARAGVLLTFSLGLMFGNLLSGNAVSMLQRRGRDPWLAPTCGMLGLVAVQAALVLLSALPDAPRGAALLAVLWFAFGAFGACGPAAYALLAQRFPPALTGRVATAINATMLALVFVLQNAIGLVLDAFPRTVADGWDPRGYAVALAVTLALQAGTLRWLARAPPARQEGSA